MPTLFNSLTSVEDARASALLCEALGDDDFDRVKSLFTAIEEGEVLAPLGTIKPDVAAFWSPHYLIIVCSGTEDIRQNASNIIGSGLARHDPIPGKVHRAFYAQAKAVLDALPGDAAPSPGRTVVTIGHSRGGAVAQILAAVWAPIATKALCYTFGAPRAGDGQFATAVGPFVVRYEDTSDPVVVLPPSPVVSLDPFFVRLGLMSFEGGYQDAGSQNTVDTDGEIIPNGERAGLSDFVQQFSRGGFPTHAIAEYRRRLTENHPDPFTPAEVDDPETWNGEEDFIKARDGQSPTLTALVGQRFDMPSPLTAGTIFFKTLDRTFGWTETWYAAMGIGSMLDALRAITDYRLAFLSPDCVIYWYRASVVEIGEPRQSQLFKRSKPVKGKAVPTGTVAGDYPNSTMDCIVATLVSQQGSKRQEKFRGLPDAYLEDDSLSNIGIGALDIINSYILQVKAAGLGIRRQNMPVTDKQAITALTQLPNGNLAITVPAHGITNDQPFRAVIRGRDLANPKIRGDWNLSVNDANTLELISSTTFGKGSGGKGGNVQVAAYAADSIVNPPAQTRLFDFNQVSTIKTGRPSDLHHGKQSAKLRHR